MTLHTYTKTHNSRSISIINNNSRNNMGMWGDLVRQRIALLEGLVGLGQHRRAAVKLEVRLWCLLGGLLAAGGRPRAVVGRACAGRGCAGRVRAQVITAGQVTVSPQTYDRLSHIVPSLKERNTRGVGHVPRALGAGQGTGRPQRLVLENCAALAGQQALGHVDAVQYKAAILRPVLQRVFERLAPRSSCLRLWE